MGLMDMSNIPSSRPDIIVPLLEAEASKLADVIADAQAQLDQIEKLIDNLRKAEDLRRRLAAGERP